MNEQILLLVDNNDVFTGKYEEKTICHTGKGLHHRAFVVLLKNKRGEILLQFRKHERWDRYWDVTAISHVLHLTDHDETYEDAALRSLSKEMGISDVNLTKIGGFNYFAKYGKQCENEYCAVLVGEYDGSYRPNPDVVYETKWMVIRDFYYDLAQNSKNYTPWAVDSVPLLKNYGF